MVPVRGRLVPSGPAGPPDGEIGWWLKAAAGPVAQNVAASATTAVTATGSLTPPCMAAQFIPDGPAGPAMRARIRDRFAELHTQRTDAEAELAKVTAAKPKAADPALPDELPYLDITLPELPPAIKARLFAAVDLTILRNKTSGQTTVTATITDATLAALPAILDPSQDGDHDTNADDIGHLWSKHPLLVSMA